MSDDASVAQSDSKSKEKRRPPNFSQVMSMWRRLIDRDSGVLTYLNNEYAAYIESDGTRNLVMFVPENKTIRRVDMKTIVNDILQASERAFVTHEDWYVRCFALVSRTAHQAAEYWLSTTSITLSNAPTVAFKGDENISFYRLPCVEFPDIESPDLVGPYFKDILERMSNSDAFSAWVWSLLDPLNSDRRQYIWLFGTGQSGKSQITEALARFLGDSVTFSNPKVCNRDNWTFSLLAKKLCVLTEADPEFPASEMFKSVTGDKRHRVTEKFMKPFNAEIDTKFLFVSNDELMIGSDRAAMSRAILCELQPFDGEQLPPEEYQDRLAMEMPAYIGYCKYQFKKLAKGGHIQANIEALIDLAEEREHRFERIFEDHFEAGDEFKEPIRDVRRVLETTGIDGLQYARFKQWMQRRFKIEKKCLRHAGVATKCFIGIKIRQVTLFGRPQKDADGNFKPPPVF